MLEAGAMIRLDAGTYCLAEQLAGSAYGVLWRALGPAGAPVALKLINRQQMERAEPPQRVRWVASAHNEIAFLRSLAPWDGRHIVRLVDSGAHDGLPVLALELLDGDLGKHLAAEREAGRQIALGQALDWLAQINQALAKVHQYGWCYLDLKPSNLLIDARRGSLKLADFGTSRALDEPNPHPYAGTASWQAPEQFFPAVAGAYLTDARSDYFALGALFYYLVTGGLPLRYCSDCGQAYREQRAGGAALLLARHGGAPPPTLRAEEAALFVQHIEHAAGAEAGVQALALLRALLACEREQRPRHAIAISRMLAAIRLRLAPDCALRSAA